MFNSTTYSCFMWNKSAEDQACCTCKQILCTSQALSETSNLNQLLPRLSRVNSVSKNGFTQTIALLTACLMGMRRVKKHWAKCNIAQPCLTLPCLQPLQEEALQTMLQMLLHAGAMCSKHSHPASAAMLLSPHKTGRHMRRCAAWPWTSMPCTLLPSPTQSKLLISVSQSPSLCIAVN